VKHRVLAASILAYRIGDPAGDYPIFSGEGARLAPGRWNDSGQAMIYTAHNYATAMLEKLARLGEMPRNQHFVEITVERGVSYEELNEAKLPDWCAQNSASARAFGARWFAEKRSAILIVPSVVARLDKNVLINPEHPHFKHIRASRERPIWWDERLFEP
jgi:RES domain-containing protein